jgi:glutaredoxin 3
MANTKATVEGKIAGKKVMVFSKSYCPYCKLGKKTLEAYLGKELNSDDYEVWEIENESNCGEIQSVLGSITGGQTVSIVAFLYFLMLVRSLFLDVVFFISIFVRGITPTLKT